MFLSYFLFRLSMLLLWCGLTDPPGGKGGGGGVEALRCYVCGGNTGRPCGDILETRRRSPYVRPNPLPSADGHRQWEVCDDLINNKGCIKQVVNEVVLLRACWMEASQRCLEDGDAQVCTCSDDLCNSSARLNPNAIWIFLSLSMSVPTNLLARTILFLLSRTFYIS
nr:uncharacterized protein LOC121127065 isoform X2 [Lepeophtheirus salmonis]XP_040578398.1 uncharacterized protein LOC121127065 isoform X2 [Lepeophtheirus salmonis]XP_040578406.1 uncharacterized protein LOC121127065 isoform X2 [Lepeophtheirus salmonis]